VSHYAADINAIVTPLCVALAYVAIQMQEWENPVVDIIEQFGKDESKTKALLEFLKVLPEELIDERRIPMEDEHINTRGEALLRRNADRVLNYLMMLLQAAGKFLPFLFILHFLYLYLLC